MFVSSVQCSALLNAKFYFRKCPQSLIAPLIKIVIDETRKLCKKQPTACGFNPADNAYEPLKLMQTVMAKTNEICLRYLDNSKLCSLPTPGPPCNAVSACAIKNNRRRMEDRHIVIHDLNSLFIEQEASPSSYYAIFDGHAGHDAAAYSCAHLHQFLAESKDFVSKPEQALRDAFLKTDALFLDKCKVENFSSGTTAVCALLRHKEKTLYIAWVGDSQAVLASQGRLIQCVQPHKPAREDEKDRIEKAGGVVIYWGMWRVNGQLAVSRAIGDCEYKPYVTAVPDIVEIPLSGAEDFLILACDGLWDVISEYDAAQCVYSMISNDPDDIESVSQRLVQLAKQKGSSDNISVIVVFLRETSKIAAEAHWATRNNLIMDTLDNANTTTNPFANSNNPDILAQKEGFVLNLADGFKHNGTEKSPISDFLDRPTNGKRSADEFDEDDDLGPETDVDAVDDVLLSPAMTENKSLNDGIANNNPSNIMFDPFNDNKEEKATLETDTELQKQQSSEFDLIKSTRDETPTPPADSVHDTSGLVDNVADSGEDSEDEWNYFKGDTAQKENIDPSQIDREVCELTSSNLDDTMSQLNPNAAEFVPVSPKRNTDSPAYRALIDDSVIAQSPKRSVPSDNDITVPNPQEFESEIKSRPSDVQEIANGGDGDGFCKLSSQEIMENFLNGKSIEEIEFQPTNSTPVKTGKTDEFHFGPNATPFSTPSKPLDQSEAFSTKAVFGDESTASYLEAKGFDNSFTDISEPQLSPKEQDPMSMSFYQDKNDTTNPFDLNKVQLLPENIDDFLEKPNESDSFNVTISDLPEHDPNEPILFSADKKSSEQEESVQLVSGNENALISKSPVPEVSSPGPQPQSPLPQSQSPLPQSQSPLPQSQSPLPQSQSPLLQSQSPLPQSQSPLPQSQSPLFQTESPFPGTQSPHLSAFSPFPQSQLPVEDQFACNESPMPQAQSPLPELLHQSHSPIPQAQSPVCSQPELLSFETCLLQSQSPVPVPHSPVPLSTTNTHSPFPSTSPVPDVESPVDDITSSVKDSPVLASSPLEVKDELPETTEVETLNFAHEISNAVQSSVTEETVSSVNLQNVDDIPMSGACEVSTPKSNASEPVDTESVATADVNSFLERSLLPDMQSPLSPSSTHSKLETSNVELNHANLLNDDNVPPVAASAVQEQEKLVDSLLCDYPAGVDIEIKSEIVAPEYPVAAIATPSEESKTEDLTQALPEETVEKIVSAVGVATVAAGAAAAATTIQKKTSDIAAKPKTATPSKKTPKSTTFPAKTPTPKPSTPKTPTSSVSATAATKTNQVKTSTVASSLTSKTATRVGATKPAPKPKTPPTTKSPAERKSLTNGDVKSTTLTAKRTLTSATSKPTTATTKSVPNKSGPIRSTTDSKTTRPATAPSKTTTTLRQTSTRPTTLATRTATTSLTKTNTSTVTTTKSTLKTSTSITSPKTTTNSLSKPKPTATARTKPLASKPSPKAADAEKQIKETTNKITASRTTTTRTVGSATGRTLTSTVRKIETKTPATRTTLTKTTTTTVKNDPKKPAELIRHPVNKTKVNAIKKPEKPQENGIDQQLVKDVSPVVENIVFDNSQLVENNVAD